MLNTDYNYARRPERPKPKRYARGRRRPNSPASGPAGPGRPPRLRIVPLNRLYAGTVVWAHIPFEDSEGYKTRPAVVVRCCRRDVVLLPCTTSLMRRQYPGCTEIKHWQVAGLHRPTGVRRASVTVDYLEIVGITGELADEDVAAILPVSAHPRCLIPPPAEGLSAA